MLLVLAQEQAGNPLLNSLLMIMIIFLIFYFLLIRPEQKKRQQHEQRINELTKGKRIITVGGIFAKVQSMKEDRAVITFGDNIKVEIEKSAIKTILDDEAENKSSS